MRTLLNESLPPQFPDEQMFSRPEPATPPHRTFSQNAVLVNLDDFAEVELGETVMVTSSAGAEPAKPALARGVAIPGASDLPFEGGERACPKSHEAKKPAPPV